jgi:hypothetical protein
MASKLFDSRLSRVQMVGLFPPSCDPRCVQGKRRGIFFPFRASDFPLLSKITDKVVESTAEAVDIFWLCALTFGFVLSAEFA